MFTFHENFLYHHGIFIAEIIKKTKTLLIYAYELSDPYVSLRHIDDGSNKLEYIFEFYSFCCGDRFDIEVVVPSEFTIDRPQSLSLSEDMKKQILELSIMLRDRYEAITNIDNIISSDTYIEVMEDVNVFSIENLDKHEKLIVGSYLINGSISKDIFNERINKYIHAFFNKPSFVKSARK